MNPIDTNANWKAGNIVDDGFGLYLILSEVEPRMLAYISDKGIFSYMSARFVESYSRNKIYDTGLVYEFQGAQQAQRDYLSKLFKPFFNLIPERTK